MNETFYLLKIRLLDMKPDIWRRFVVPGNITLDRLHDVIQIVMGWTNSHLHEFTIHEKRYTESPQSGEDGLDCGEYRLSDLVNEEGHVFRYHYDFGDYWEHEVTVEDRSYVNPELQYVPVCLDGDRACPPEDVGGVIGYQEFCDVIKNPKDPEHEQLMQWSGGNYDSERFELEETNDELLKYIQWSRNRHQPW